jgi:PAS domain S-box-containing protein
MERKNCWEVIKCGQEPGGKNVHKLGVCPAALPNQYEGINEGKYCGRFCWTVAGTFCGGQLQGSYANKLEDCLKCEFLKQVHKDEDKYFILTPDFIKKPNNRKKYTIMLKKYFPVIIALTVGFILTILGTHLVRSIEQKRGHSEFYEAAKERISALEHAIHNSFEVLHATQAFYISSNKEIEWQEFDTFTSSFLSRNDYIQTLAWIPQLPHNQRTAFERAAQSEHSNFRLTERTFRGEMIKASQRQIYFPIRYVAPYPGNERKLGFDLASEPSSLATMKQARDTGTMIMQINQFKKAAYHPNILVFYPLYDKQFPVRTRAQRRKRLRGFILGMFRVNYIISEALQFIRPRGIDIRIQDETDTPIKLYTHYSRIRSIKKNPNNKMKLKKSFEVIGRTWSITCIPTLNYQEIGRTWVSLATFIAGIIGTLLIAVYLFDSIKHTTRVQQTKKDLEESEKYWRSLIEESLSGLVLFNIEGHFVEINPAFLDIIGYSFEELRQKTLWDIMPKKEGEKENMRQFRVLETVGRCGPYEKEFLHKNGHKIHVNFSAVIVENKEKPFIWASIENISERKEAEIKLLDAKEAAEKAKIEAESANRTKSVFLANMSHELRTPLNGILGFAQILKNDQTLGSQQRDAIHTIQQSGEHLLLLLNDILDMAKVEAGKMELHLTEFQFNNFLKGIANIIQIRAQQKDTQFNYEFQSDLPIAVKGDSTRLRQVLINLLGNAVKFTEQGLVKFKVSRHKDKIRFLVEDTGIGIAQEELKTIFEAFQQVGHQKYKMEGTGLGLPISKRLVELMDSTLNVKSTLGKGSVFWFDLRLPEVSGWQSVNHTPELTIIGFKGKSRKILIIDDNKTNRAVLIGLISHLGFEIAEASNGQEGVEKALTEQPDIILMDLVMPIMDGFEATRKIRQSEQLSEVVIIAVSASVQHKEESLSVGCNDFVAKPIQTEKELLNLFSKYLELEWIYEEIASETTIEQGPLISPPLEELEVLHELAISGNMRRIKEQAKHIEQLDEKYIPFAHKVLNLAKNFEDEKILALVEERVRELTD